jgi:hypothetical protein
MYESVNVILRLSIVVLLQESKAKDKSEKEEEELDSPHKT